MNLLKQLKLELPIKFDVQVDTTVTYGAKLRGHLKLI